MHLFLLLPFGPNTRLHQGRKRKCILKSREVGKEDGRKERINKEGKKRKKEERQRITE